jgi:hypothetical protein
MLTELTHLLVLVKMDIMKINLPVVVNFVTINVSPVSPLLVVTNVLKTELLLQIVSVKKDSKMLVMLYVNHVTGDINLVILNQYVLTSDTKPQIVHVSIHTMKKKIFKLVLHVTLSVLDVLIPHITVLNVLVTELISLFVNVQLDLLEI